MNINFFLNITKNIGTIDIIVTVVRRIIVKQLIWLINKKNKKIIQVLIKYLFNLLTRNAKH